MTTWIVLRAAGIGAYLMLFASVAWGLIATTSVFGKKVSKATSVSVHQFVSTVALLLLGIHLGGLLLDTFVRFHPLDVLIPLHSAYLPVATAFGVLAMYSVVIVLASSWTRKHVGPTWWRRLHLLTVPAFILAMVHGVFAGTDTARPAMWWTYVATAAIVLFLVVLRGLTSGLRPQRHAVPVNARTPAADSTAPPKELAAVAAGIDDGEAATGPLSRPR
ncbi:MAG TPA: hypothetical protein VGH10_04730 [Actinomycetota bacterium]